MFLSTLAVVVVSIGSTRLVVSPLPILGAGGEMRDGTESACENYNSN